MTTTMRMMQHCIKRNETVTVFEYTDLLSELVSELPEVIVALKLAHQVCSAMDVLTSNDSNQTLRPSFEALRRQLSKLGDEQVFAVAVESESSGAVGWYYLAEDASLAFESQVRRFNDLPGETISLFAVTVQAWMSPDEITTEVDAAMHEEAYTPIRRYLTS